MADIQPVLNKTNIRKMNYVFISKTDYESIALGNSGEIPQVLDSKGNQVEYDRVAYLAGLQIDTWLNFKLQELTTYNDDNSIKQHGVLRLNETQKTLLIRAFVYQVQYLYSNIRLEETQNEIDYSFEGVSYKIPVIDYKDSPDSMLTGMALHQLKLSGIKDLAFSIGQSVLNDDGERVHIIDSFFNDKDAEGNPKYQVSKVSYQVVLDNQTELNTLKTSIKDIDFSKIASDISTNATNIRDNKTNIVANESEITINKTTIASNFTTLDNEAKALRSMIENRILFDEYDEDTSQNSIKVAVNKTLDTPQEWEPHLASVRLNSTKKNLATFQVVSEEDQSILFTKPIEVFDVKTNKVLTSYTLKKGERYYIQYQSVSDKMRLIKEVYVNQATLANLQTQISDNKTAFDNHVASISTQLSTITTNITNLTNSLSTTNTNLTNLTNAVATHRVLTNNITRRNNRNYFDSSLTFDNQVLSESNANKYFTPQQMWNDIATLKGWKASKDNVLDHFNYDRANNNIDILKNLVIDNSYGLTTSSLTLGSTTITNWSDISSGGSSDVFFFPLRKGSTTWFTDRAKITSLSWMRANHDPQQGVQQFFQGENETGDINQRQFGLYSKKGSSKDTYGHILGIDYDENTTTKTMRIYASNNAKYRYFAIGTGDSLRVNYLNHNVEIGVPGGQNNGELRVYGASQFDKNITLSHDPTLTAIYRSQGINFYTSSPSGSLLHNTLQAIYTNGKPELYWGSKMISGGSSGSAFFENSTLHNNYLQAISGKGLAFIGENGIMLDQDSSDSARSNGLYFKVGSNTAEIKYKQYDDNGTTKRRMEVNAEALEVQALHIQGQDIATNIANINSILNTRAIYNEYDEINSSSIIKVKTNNNLSNPRDWIVGLASVKMLTDKTNSGSGLSFRVYNEKNEPEFNLNARAYDEATKSYITNFTLHAGQRYPVHLDYLSRAEMVITIPKQPLYQDHIKYNPTTKQLEAEVMINAKKGIKLAKETDTKSEKILAETKNHLVEIQMREDENGKPQWYMGDDKFLIQRDNPIIKRVVLNLTNAERNRVYNKEVCGISYKLTDIFDYTKQQLYDRLKPLYEEWRKDPNGYRIGLGLYFEPSEPIRSPYTQMINSEAFTARNHLLMPARDEWASSDNENGVKIDNNTRYLYYGIGSGDARANRVFLAYLNGLMFADIQPTDSKWDFTTPSCWGFAYDGSRPYKHLKVEIRLIKKNESFGLEQDSPFYK